MVAAVIPPGHPAAYDVLVGLHVVCAVIGFGAVAISGAYAAIGRHIGSARSRPETEEEVRRYFASDSRLEYLLLVAPVFGVAAMAVRPGGSEFGQLWAIGGIVVWVVAGGLLTAVVRPSERRIRAAAEAVAAAPTSRPAVAPDARRLMWAAAGSDLLFALALLLMVTQPR